MIYIFVLIGCLVYYSPVFISIIHKRKLWKLCKNHRCLVLTFDDGPSSVMTVRLLKLLKNLEVNANFFVLGKHVENNIKVVELLKLNGHEVGSHSFYHFNAWKINPFRLLDDLIKGLNISSPYLTVPLFFRPPNGKLVFPSLLWVMKNNLRLALWTLDSGDTHDVVPSSTHKLVNQLIKDGGGVVLLHDFDRSIENKCHEDYVLKVVEDLVLAARENNIKIKTLSEIL